MQRTIKSSRPGQLFSQFSIMVASVQLEQPHVSWHCCNNQSITIETYYFLPTWGTANLDGANKSDLVMKFVASDLENAQRNKKIHNYLQCILNNPPHPKIFSEFGPPPFSSGCSFNQARTEQFPFNVQPLFPRPVLLSDRSPLSAAVVCKLLGRTTLPHPPRNPP